MHLPGQRPRRDRDIPDAHAFDVLGPDLLVLAQHDQLFVGQAAGHRVGTLTVVRERRDLDHAGRALAVFTGKIDRNVMFLGDLQNGLGVRAGHGVDGLVLVDRA